MNKEYVIQNPKTPYPWINYLGTQAFFSLISNTAGGYHFYKDARLRRITRYRYNNVPVDMGGRYFYIKDNDTIWSPGWAPVKPNWTAMNAVTVWVIPSSLVRKRSVRRSYVLRSAGLQRRNSERCSQERKQRSKDFQAVLFRRMVSVECTG